MTSIKKLLSKHAVFIEYSENGNFVVSVHTPISREDLTKILDSFYSDYPEHTVYIDNGECDASIMIRFDKEDDD